jgi:hypothetical protein
VEQDVEKSRQLCSRIAQGLKVPDTYTSAFHSLRPWSVNARLGALGWAGENDGLFEHPVRVTVQSLNYSCFSVSSYG